MMPPVTGMCMAAQPRWFFNSQTDRCEEFLYGGCGGNANNFLSQEECKKMCSQGNVTEDGKMADNMAADVVK